jgi:hypothetical protein
MSLAVHATNTTPPPPPSPGAVGVNLTLGVGNSQKVESGGSATDYALEDMSNTVLNTAEDNPGYEQQLLDIYGPEVAGAAVDAVKNGDISGLKSVLKDSVGDKVLEDKANREVKEREKSTRVYGISLYHGIVDGCTYDMAESQVASVVANKMRSGGGLSHIGYMRFGGQNGDTSGWTLSRDIWSKLKSANGQEARAFIDLASMVLPANVVQDYHQKLETFMKVGSGPLPVIVGYLAFADGGGAPTDLIGMGMAGSSVLGSEGEVTALGHAIEAKIGTTMGTTMLTGQGIAKGSSATTLDMTPFGGLYFAGGFAIPIKYKADDGGGGGGGGSAEATFYVEASPHNAYNDWEVNQQVTGTYRLKMNIPDKELAKFGDSSGMATVTIKHNFNAANHSKPAELRATGAIAQLVNKDYWTNIQSRLNLQINVQGGVTGTSTLKIPVEHLSYLGQNGIEYAVTITGSKADKEQHRPASFEVQINGQALTPAPTGAVIGFENHNPIGSNYTSWHDKPNDTTGDFYIQAYDKHSGNASVEGKVVANTAKAGDETWNADVAIPSTENVSVKTGASSGMMDAYGFVMAYPGGMATANPGGARPGFADPNDKGTAMPNPAATRTVELVGQVVNCWGENNPVCQLARSGNTVKSGGITQSAGHGSVYQSVGYSCHCCSGSYNNMWHSASRWVCTNHNGETGWNAYTNHTHNGGHSSCSDYHDEDGNVVGHGGNSAHDGSVNANSHNCTYSVTVYDAIGEDFVGQKLSWATGPGATKTYVSGRTLVNGGSYFDGFLSVSNSGQSGINIYCTKFVVTVSQDAQFYMIDYAFVSEDRASGSGGCFSFGSPPGNKSWPAGTVVSGKWPADQVMCSDYTHGTGTGGTHYENMAHQGTHKYIMKYVESVNTYAYRTIESASVYSLQNISIGSLNSISRAEGKDAGGTFWKATTELAPISEGVGYSVSSPTAAGYLWKTTGPGNGKYDNGNGRILWQAWNAESASVAPGNVTAGTQTGGYDYFLGDVTVNINVVQDHEFARTMNSGYQAVVYDPAEVSGTLNTRGHDMARYHDRNQRSTLKYEVTAHDEKYTQIGTGDCTALTYDKTKLDNSGGIHSTIVPKEISAAMNYWIGLNSGRGTPPEKQIAFRANIISDTMAYGGMSSTNIFLDDAYAVDSISSKDPYDEQAGAALFSMLANHNGSGISGPDVMPDLPNVALGQPGTTTIKEVTLYRNHYNDPANGDNDPLALLRRMYNGNLSADRILADRDPLALFGGTNGFNPGGNASTALSTAFSAANGFAGTFGKGCIPRANGGLSSATYSKELDVTANHGSPASGVVRVEVTTNGASTGSSSFTGYWKDFKYNSVAPGVNTTKLNGRLQANISSRENGETCINEYGTLAISNLALTDWTPNDNWPTGSVKAAYNHNAIATAPSPLDSSKGGSYDIANYSSRTVIQEGHNAIVANGISAGMNRITIFNPVSVENDYVIGAQVGDFEPTITDDRDHDQRIDERTGNFLTDELKVNEINYVRNTKPYVVQSQYLWTWLSPFGNFASVGDGGSTNTSTSDLTNGGVIQRNAGHKKFVNNMNVLKWIGGASIQYPFVAGTKSMAWYKEYDRVPLDDMISAHAGTGGILAGNAPSSKLDDFYGDKFKWGNAFGVTNTSNVTESNIEDANAPHTYVTIEAYTINPFVKTSDNSAQIGYILEEGNNAGNKRSNAVFKTDPVNLVGSIGNVTVHDVEDFRFSNYFKEAIPNKWLIDGVIQQVDVNKPLRVVSSEKDICFNEVKYFVEGGEHYKLDHDTGTRTKVATGYTASGHSTLATTMFTLDGSYGGMAGYYDPLPLVPRYNTVEEFKSEAVRLGYKAFMSVDTIGQYESFIDNTVKVPSGPDTEDTREKFLTVKSEYYLYDLDDGKLYDIDIWSGSTGGKERVYNGTSKVTEQFTHSGSIYQNVVEDSTRRNIGLLETMKTSGFANGANKEPGEYTFVNSVNHYIGRPGHLKLDNRDLSYIGSSNNDSEGRYWGATLGYPSEWSQNAQRYHFKDGLTSTTVITKPLGADRSTITQGMIETASHEVKEEHPNAVVIQFMDFIAKGDVWDIRHNGSAVNSPSFTIYDVNGDDPDDPNDDDKYIPKDMDITKVKRHNEVKYRGAKTLNPVTGAESGTIDPNLTPVVVFQAYNTSADDRTISGTH